MANQNRNVNYFQVAATQAQYEQFVHMIHEADEKRELHKALNFQTIPQTFLVDKSGNIVYKHNGYNPGDEYELEEEIKKLTY